MKKILLYCLSLACFVSLHAKDYGTSHEDLPTPYNSVALLPYNPHGWYVNHNELQDLIKRYGVETVVELGSWMGMSTIDIAQMLPENGLVYAVDTWEGSPQSRDSLQHYLPTLYEQFLSNVIHKKMTHKIVPIKMRSTDAAELFDDQPGLVYIDAEHSFEACYADLQAWYPHVYEYKGILCGNGWGLYNRAVGRAVEKFAQEYDLLVHTNGNFWWLEYPQD